MTTQNALGSLQCSDGSTIQLTASITDATVVNGSGTFTEVTTDPAWTGVAQSVGDFAAGKTCVQGWISAKTFIEFAFVLRNGKVEHLIPCGSRTAGGSGSMGDFPLCRPWTVIPGDKVYVATLA